MSESRDNGAVLTVADLQAWYGESKALHGMNFHVKPGELVTLLGRNGAGKTTALRSIMGLVRRKSGTIRFHGEDLSHRPAEFVARRGIAYCPEERGIFASLSVGENLELPPVIAADGMSVDEIFALFPNLKQRWSSPGTKLSGGEQQMLAIGRALLTRPRLVLLDEPSMGLAPRIVQEIFEIIVRLNREKGTAFLLAEQNAALSLAHAERAYVLESGRVALEGSASDLAARDDLHRIYLGYRA